MRLIHLCGVAALAVAGSVQAQEFERQQSPDCSEFEPNSLEAALFDCDGQSVPAEGPGPQPDDEMDGTSVDEATELSPSPEFEYFDEAAPGELPSPNSELATVEAVEGSVEEPAQPSSAAEVVEDELEVVAPDDLSPSDDDVASAEADAEYQATREWLERHRIGDPIEAEAVELLDDSEMEDLPPPSPGARYAEIDGMLVELDPESYELLQLIRRSAGVEEEPDRATVTEVEEPTVRDRSERNEARQERVREREERRREREERRDDRGGDLDIPPGHLPPPGECRLWFPDRPAGHQPPPTSCDVRVPEGAVLIRG